MWTKQYIQCVIFDGWLLFLFCHIWLSREYLVDWNVLRLRQLRVENSCDIDPAFQKTILYCYGPYAQSIEETRSFLPAAR